MSRAMFFSAIVAAICLSLAAGALMTTFGLVMNTGDALRLMVLIVGLGYAGWLQRWLVIRFGASLLATGGLLLALLLITFNPGVIFWLVALSGFLWLLRSSGRYERLGLAAADGLLTATSLIVAIAIFQHTGSFALSTWGMLLTLAFCSFIPARHPPLTPRSETGDGRFTHAYRTANDALSRLGRARP